MHKYWNTWNRTFCYKINKILKEKIVHMCQQSSVESGENINSEYQEFTKTPSILYQIAGILYGKIPLQTISLLSKNSMDFLIIKE